MSGHYLETNASPTTLSILSIVTQRLSSAKFAKIKYTTNAEKISLQNQSYIEEIPHGIVQFHFVDDPIR